MAYETLLSKAKLLEFRVPPTIRPKEYDAFFDLSPEAERHFKRQNGEISKISFLMAYCFCKTESRFFSASNYSNEILLAASERYSHLRNCPSKLRSKEKSIVFKNAIRDATSRHKVAVTRLLGKVNPNNAQIKILSDQARLLSMKQTGPSLVFDTLVERCIERNWLVPSASTLMKLIGSHYNQFKNATLKKIEENLTEEKRIELFKILEKGDDGKYLITKLKKVTASKKVRPFLRNISLANEVKEYFGNFECVISSLDLNDQTVSFYSNWIHQVDITQIKQLTDNRDIALRLLCFLYDNHLQRQDSCVESYLAKLREEKRVARDSVKSRYSDANSEEMEEILGQLELSKSKSEVIQSILDLAKDIYLTSDERIERIVNTILDFRNQDELKNDLADCLDIKDKIKDLNSEVPVFSEMAEDAKRIVKMLNASIDVMEFDPNNECEKLFDCIQRNKLGSEIDPSCLSGKRKTIWNKIEPSRETLQLLFFDEIASNIQSGKLSLLHSYNYKRLSRLLIPDEEWTAIKIRILKATNLYRFIDFDRYRETSTNRLDTMYDEINMYSQESDCNDLTVDSDGKVKLSESGKEKEAYEQAISTLLYDARGTSITRIMTDINSVTPYDGLFPHSTHTGVVKGVEENQLVGAVLSQGLNLGSRKMFENSVGLDETTLSNIVRFRLTKDNLKRANDRVNAAIDELPLSAEFQKYFDALMSSSDGQKQSVMKDSLISAHSHKYFHQDSGITRYPMVDEKGRVRNVTVFSPIRRESQYLIDVLASNITDIPFHHATDTHGYTEPVFACTHLMGVRFMPRIKDLEDQVYYGARSAKWYKDKGYSIRPKSKINWNLIESNWDEILRFMASILSGKCLASQLFNRLNSYAADHPLYKGLKELGRVEKSFFLLCYYRYKEIRNNIQRQLNLGEHMNRFTKALTWGKSNRLIGETLEEYERAAGCTQFIQNCIIYWNYLYASERLAKIRDTIERERLVIGLAAGQMVAWGHVNYTGTFQFRRRSKSTVRFDLDVLTNISLLNKNKGPSPWYPFEDDFL